MAPSKNNATAGGDAINCQDRPRSLMLFHLAGLLLFSKFLRPLFRWLSLPDIIPDAVAGMALGAFDGGEGSGGLVRIFRTISEAGMMCYTFAVGLEMDVRSIFQVPDRAAIIAYAGILSTVALFVPFGTIMQGEAVGVFEDGDAVQNTVIASVLLSNTASPLLTRLITDLKIGKSEVGRLAVSVGIMNDMITLTFLAITTLFEPYVIDAVEGEDSPLGVGYVFVVMGAEVLFIRTVVRRFNNWVNRQNPEGRPMNPSHLVLASILAMILSFIPAMIGFSGILSSFVIGLLFPREGRLSRQMVHRINIFLNVLVYPLFFGWVGNETVRRFKIGRKQGISVARGIGRFAAFTAVGTAGKVTGTTVAAICFGFQFPEAIALGMLLTVKGPFHIFYPLKSRAAGQTIVRISAYPAVLTSTMFTILYTPLVVKLIILRARRKAANRIMTLQWHDPNTELRMMLCVHGPHNIPASINIIEASRGNPGSGTLTVFAMDLVHLTQRTAATLTHGQGLDAVAVTDESIMKMREEITVAFEAFVEESGEGLTIRRLLAISPYENMHEDICNAATDSLTMIIILPFHRSQRIDGVMDESFTKFRRVNRKVLQRAPCSVGILVDRGLGGTNQLSAAYASHQVAAIFIGGCDDREALAYAARMAYHPGIKLSVIRFIAEAGAETSSIGASARILTDLHELEKEMALDDEYFASFYERHIANGHVGYVEKYVMNAAETVATLRALEGLYSLFIVGRGSQSRLLTAGMSDWEEFPELGSIGDILSSSDFSVTASVLIVKQHNPMKQEQDAEDDEFSIAT